MKFRILCALILSTALLSGHAVAQSSETNDTNSDVGDGVITTCLYNVDPIPVDPTIFPRQVGSNSTTTVSGISGGVIFGSFVDSSVMTEGFSSDGTNYTTIDHPEASGFTEVRGFSGGVYAGNFTDSNGLTHGFLFDGTNYTTVDAPSANGYTSITGFHNGAYVGNYIDTNWTSLGFVYDGTNYTTFVHPDAANGSASLNGFSEGVTFGSYTDTNYVTHGFLYDGTNYTSIDYPGSSFFTEVTGYSGGSVTGNFIDTNGLTHGFLFDGINYTTVDAPSANGYTSITGADAGTYAGNYIDVDGSTHGFLYDGTNYTVIDAPLAAQIPCWIAWDFRGASSGVVKKNPNAVSPKKQRINVRVYKTSAKRVGNPSAVRVVATSPAGGVSFLTSSNAVVTSTSTYRSPKSRVYVTTAIINSNDSKKVTVTASQLGNSEFAPARTSVNSKVGRRR
jgi:hypothetical protein